MPWQPAGSDAREHVLTIWSGGTVRFTGYGCRISRSWYRRNYCSNMAKSGMNPKTLQYLMGHSDIGVTLNTYTHLGLEDAVDELKRVEELENARRELEKNKEEKPVLQKMFRAI